MKGILTAGIDSSLCAAVLGEAENHADSCVAAVIPNHFSAARQGGEKAAGERSAGTGIKTGLLDWNPGSPVSARALLLAAENRLPSLNLAVLVCAPPHLRRRPEELLPAEAEIIASEYLKGWFLLVREITIRFGARKDPAVRPGAPPMLALVLAEPGPAEKGEIPEICAAPVAAAFRALAQGIIASQGTRAWNVFAFSSDRAEDAEFAAFIFKTLEDNSARAAGKWSRYGKFPLFK